MVTVPEHTITIQHPSVILFEEFPVSFGIIRVQAHTHVGCESQEADRDECLGPSKKGGDNGLNDLLVCVGGEQARERNPHCYRK